MWFWSLESGSGKRKIFMCLGGCEDKGLFAQLMASIHISFTFYNARFVLSLHCADCYGHVSEAHESVPCCF